MTEAKTMSDLVHSAFAKNMELNSQAEPNLRVIVHQQRLWRSLQVTFAQSKDVEALAVQAVLPEDWRHPTKPSSQSAPAKSSSLKTSQTRKSSPKVQRTLRAH